MHDIYIYCTIPRNPPSSVFINEQKTETTPTRTQLKAEAPQVEVVWLRWESAPSFAPPSWSCFEWHARWRKKKQLHNGVSHILSILVLPNIRANLAYLIQIERLGWPALQFRMTFWELRCPRTIRLEIPKVQESHLEYLESILLTFPGCQSDGLLSHFWAPYTAGLLQGRDFSLHRARGRQPCADRQTWHGNILDTELLNGLRKGRTL